MLKNPRTMALIALIAVTPLAVALTGSRGCPDVHRPRAAELEVFEIDVVEREAKMRPADCVCAHARKTNGWCRSCQVGYVASIRISSPMLFEALDAHGHAIEPELLRCDACRRAVETDAFCDRSGIGYVRRQAYLSKLAYHAARGEVKDRSELDCATCRKNAEDHGWCDSCGIGMVGPLALESRADLEEARQAIDRLGRALRELATCETCAVATMTGGRCSVCRISYAADR